MDERGEKRQIPEYTRIKSGIEVMTYPTGALEFRRGRSGIFVITPKERKEFLEAIGAVDKPKPKKRRSSKRESSDPDA